MVYTRINAEFIPIFALKITEVYTPRKEDMTDKTKVITVRVPTEVYEKLRNNLRQRLIDIANGVSDCEGCPYIDDLDLSKFNEVCEFKGIDRQKAIDKCVQMLWR